MKINIEKKQQVIDFLSKSIGGDLVDDLAQYCLEKNCEDSEQLENYFTDRFYEFTADAFVYYDDAINYLSRNDPSLQNSMELAAEFGYNLEKIDSCLLANILYQNDRSTEELGIVNFQELFNIINQ